MCMDQNLVFPNEVRGVVNRIYAGQPAGEDRVFVDPRRLDVPKVTPRVRTPHQEQEVCVVSRCLFRLL